MHILITVVTFTAAIISLVVLKLFGIVEFKINWAGRCCKCGSFLTRTNKALVPVDLFPKQPSESNTAAPPLIEDCHKFGQYHYCLRCRHTWDFKRLPTVFYVAPAELDRLFNPISSKPSSMPELGPHVDPSRN